MFSIFDGVFPIHDDHCKLTFTTSTSFFVSRSHIIRGSFFLFNSTRLATLCGKELHPVTFFVLFCLAADLVYIPIDMIR